MTLPYPSGTETSTNLIAGFKKCGASPFRPKAVTDRGGDGAKRSVATS